MTTPNIRSRHPTRNPATPPHTPSPSPSPSPSPQAKTHEATHSSDPDTDTVSTTPSVLDILRLLLGILLLSTTLSYFITSSLTWNYPHPAFTRPQRIRAWLHGPLSLTPAQLSRYNGSDPALPIYLALNGSVYDVSASPHLYGPGGSYHFFAGRDATRAFVTGCFDTDLTGDVRGVEEMFVPLDEEGEVVSARERKVRREREMRVARGKVREAVRGWERMFDGGKGGKYFWVGRVVGGEKEWEGTAIRELCESAQRGRKRRGEGEKGREGVRRAEEV